MRLPHAWSARLAIALAMAMLAAPAVVHAKQGKTRTEAGDRPFIEQSLIAAPRQVGEFELEGHRYDPESRYAGVNFRYRLPAHPELRIDIFVYPAGQMPEQDAVKLGMETFVATLEEAVRQQYFDRFELVGRDAFEIMPAVKGDAVKRDAIKSDSAAQASEQAQDDGVHDDSTQDESSQELEALLSAMATQPIRGERLDLRYRMPIGFDEPVPMHSRGYLFYRQLYYFKGRLTATEAAIGREEFAALADRAVREIVPAIQARHVGGCAQHTININTAAVDAGQDDSLIMRELAGSLMQMSGKNCYDTIDKARQPIPDGTDIVTITFAPDDWGSNAP